MHSVTRSSHCYISLSYHSLPPSIFYSSCGTCISHPEELALILVSWSAQCITSHMPFLAFDLCSNPFVATSNSEFFASIDLIFWSTSCLFSKDTTHHLPMPLSTCYLHSRTLILISHHLFSLWHSLFFCLQAVFPCKIPLTTSPCHSLHFILTLEHLCLPPTIYFRSGTFYFLVYKLPFLVRCHSPLPYATLSILFSP